MDKEKKNAYLITNVMEDVSMLFTGEELTMINDILSEYNDYLFDQIDEADTHEEEESIMRKRYEIEVIMIKLSAISRGW